VFQYSVPVTSEQAAEPVASDRLGAAVRGLADAVVRTGADPEELAAAAATVETLTERVAAGEPYQRVHDTPYHPMSLVGGSAHPIAPQLRVSASRDGVSGTVVLGPSCEGGPGLVHGGVLSLIFDHVMGQAVFSAGYSAMTVSLEVRYRAPTPLDAPLAFTAAVERSEGRKIFVGARVAVDGAVTAEARGVFVQLTADNVARIFPSDRVPPGPPPAP
jgi:acyl-coenzyme A thioesterase PaaI-like protein